METDLTFDYIDLFAGIGGIRIPFDEIGGRCVMTCEIDKHSQQTYNENFHRKAHHLSVMDINNILPSEIPYHDVLLAGFPCQPFSLAGVSKKKSLGKAHGFECETQGTLFFNIEKILEYHRPAAFFLENVKNLLSHDKKRTFQVISRTLERLGYKFCYRVVDARGYVPQHRERVYIAGFREDVGFDIKNTPFKKSEQGPKLKNILHSPDNVLDRTSLDSKKYIDTDTGLVLDKYTLSDKLWNYLQGYAEKHRKKGNGFGFGLFGPEDSARTLSARYYKDGSEILIRQENKNPRRLTPRECARLQGFGEQFSIPVSDTQAYRQFGNSVAVPVVREIAIDMKPYLKEILSCSGEVEEKIAS